MIYFVMGLSPDVIAKAEEPGFKISKVVNRELPEARSSLKMSDSEIDTIDNLDYEHVGRRALHNAQERKRRNHIKENFNNLRDSVPTIQGEKSVSRAQILKKAGDYILYMKRRNLSHQQDIDDLKRQNTILEQQIKSIEKSLNLGQRDMYSNSDSSDLEEDFSV